MTTPPHTAGLRKDISLFGVFAIALGTTISSGFFLLPGLAFAQAGPAIIVSYLLAGLVVLPPYSVNRNSLQPCLGQGACTSTWTAHLDRLRAPLLG